MRRLTFLLAGSLVVAGCVGTIDRADFEDEIRARGGGFDQSLVIDAVDGVAAVVGTDEYEITHLSASPEAAVVTMEVRDPRNPDQLDDYTFRNGTLESTEPVQVSASDDLDAEAFPITEFALDDLNRMVDETLEVYDTDGGYVQSVSFVSVVSPEHPDQQTGAITMQLESPRSSASARLTPSGQLVSVERQ